MATELVPPPTSEVSPEKLTPTPLPSKAGEPPKAAEPPVVAQRAVSTDDLPLLDEPGGHHAAGFFNLPWVQNIMPLATAILFHVVIIGLGFALVPVAQKLINPNKDQVIIPEAKLADKAGMPGGVPHPGPTGDKTRDMMQMISKETKNEGLNDKPSDAEMSLNDPGAGKTDHSEYGVGSKSATGRGGTMGTGTPGGSLAPFGPPGGGGDGNMPKSTIFGVGGNANNIVFLCDCSGSMLTVFSNMKLNLKQSINQLAFGAGGARQMFNVIFFSDAGPILLFPDGMQPATEPNRKAAMDFIDNQSASGQTIPLKAIQAAMSQNPQLLQVMTDGFDNVSSFDDVINAFKIPKDAKMKINCIHFKSGEDPKLEQVLRTIAEKNGGGKYQAVNKSDMN